MPFQLTGTNSQDLCTVKLPTSKSISNRLLFIRALSKETFAIRGLSAAEDTILLNELLSSHKSEVNAKDAGTVYRFLAAYYSCIPGTHILKGTKRMHERPIGPLVDALNLLGANITYLGEKGFPPLSIEGTTLRGGKVSVDASISSQFISALLMIAPTLEDGLTVQMEGEIASASYIRMTLDLMSLMGVESEWIRNEIRIPQRAYSPSEVDVEPDWSSAAFWYLLSALSPGRTFFLEGLHQSKLQGDSVIADWMKLLGVDSVFEENGVTLLSHGYSSWSQHAALQFDFKDCPDLFPPMLVACAALGVEAKLTSLQNLIHKESNRLDVLLKELGKCGLKYTLVDDQHSLILQKQKLSPPDRIFETHQDHRVAMALAPLSQIFGNVSLNEIAVVQKSYPEFWTQLSAAGFLMNKIT